MPLFTTNVFDSFPMGVLLLTENLEITYANVIARKSFNWEEKIPGSFLNVFTWWNSKGEILAIDQHPVMQCFHKGEAISGTTLGFSPSTEKEICWLQAHCIFEAATGREQSDQVVFTFQATTKPGKVVNSDQSLSESKDRLPENNLHQLIENEKNYRGLFETNPAPMWIFDTETLFFLEVNHAAIDHYGYSRDEFLQMTIKEIRPDEEVSKLVDYLLGSHMVLNHSDQWRHKKKNGEVIDVEIFSYAIDYHGRKAKHILAIDVTEKQKALRKLKISEVRFRKLFENMAQGVIYQDARGVILSANTAAQQILGLTLDQMVGRTSFNPKWKLVKEDGSELSKEEDPSWIALRSGKEIRNVTIGVLSPELEEYIWLLVDAVPEFKEGATEAYRVFTTFNDITWQKKSERRIRKSKKKYKTLFDTMPNGYYRSTPEGYFVEANPAYIKMLGYDTLKELKSLFIPEALYLCANERDEISTDNPEYIDEIETYRLKKKNGDIVWIEDNARCIRDDNGNIKYYEGICRDITDRKLAEDKLREREEKYRTLFSSMDQGFCIIEKISATIDQPIDFRYLEANPAFEHHTGLVDVVGKTIRQVVPHAEQEIFDIYEDVVQSRKHHKFETYFASLDFWMEAEVIPTEKPNQIAVLFTNVSERKLGEESLRRREMLLREMGRIASIGGWELDCTTMKQEWTDEIYAIHDQEPGSYDPNIKEELSRFEPGSKELIEKALDAALTQGKPYDLEVEMTTIKGNRKWVRVVCQPLLEAGIVCKLTGTVQDITTRKQTATKLHESERRFAALFRSNPTPTGITREVDYRIVDVNDAWCKLTGYSRDEAIGYNSVELGMATPQTLDKIRDSVHNQHANQQTEIQIYTHSGEERHVLINSEMIDVSGEKFVLNNLLDITQRRLDEQQLSKLAERLNLATHSARIGIWDWDIQKDKLVWDEQMVALYGLRPGEFKGAYEAWLKGVHPQDQEESNNISQMALRGERDYDTEFRVLWPDGSVHWLKAEGKVFRDENETAIRMVGVNYDITERKKAEVNLKRWADTFENVAFGFVIGEPQNKALGLMNPAFAKMHGYTHEELIGVPITEVFAPEVREELPGQLELVHQKGHHAFKSLHIRKDGTIFPVLVDAVAVKDQNGNVLYRIASVQDITERKLAEQHLHENQTLLNQVLDSEPDAIFAVDLNYRLLVNNKRHQQVLVHAGGHQLRAGESIFPSDYPKKVLNYWCGLYDRAYSGEEFTLEMEWPFSDGQLHTMDTYFSPLRNPFGEITGALVVIHDITDRKIAEQKLSESEQKLKLFVEYAPASIAMFDTDMKYIAVSKRYLADYAIQDTKIVGRSHYDIFPEIGNEWKAVHRRCLEGAIEINEDDSFPRADGSVDWVRWEIHPWYQNNEKIGGIILFSELITERKKAKLDLESSESKFRSIAENLSDVIAISDDKGIISYISPASVRVFGFQSEEMTGKFFGEFLAPEERERLAEIYKENIELNYTSQNLLIKAIRKDGEQFYAEISSSRIIEDKNINGRLALIRDVTDVRLSEIRERNRSRILQMLTEEFQLNEILYQIQLSIEEEDPDSICTILLLDKTGKCLQSAIPNRLPDFYNQAIDGLETGMGKGSCGTAVFTRETVFIENILTHPYWEPFRELAQRANVKSCWSKPVISFSGHVLGTFAIYSRRNRLPNQTAIARIDYAANLTRLAIEKKTSEEDLRASEAKFKAVFENAPVGISLLDNQRNLLESNNMLAHIVHLNEAALAAGRHRARKYIREDGSELTVDELASTRAITEQRPIRNVVNGIMLENGPTIWTQVSAAPLGPNDPRYVVITQDITDRIKALDALKENEQRLRKTIETTSDGFWIVDSTRQFIEVNEAYCKMSGYSRQELMTMNISDVEAVETTLDTNERIRKIIGQGGDRFETVHRRKDGSLFNVEMGVNLLDSDQGLMICFCRDITERKLAEKQLIESEKRFSSIFEDSPVAIAISRLNDGGIIHVNKSAIDLLGFSQEELIGNTTLDLEIWAISEDRQRFVQSIRTHLRVEEMETVIKLKDGQNRRVLVWGEFIELAGESCVMVEIIDITEKKIQEEEIRLQNEKLNAILNALPDKLFVHDTQGTFLEAYTTNSDGFIVPMEQFIGKKISDIFPQKVADINLKHLGECLETKELITHEFSTNYKGIDSHFEVRVVPFMEDKVIRFVRDITQKKENERQITKLNKAIEQSPVAIIITDANAIITYVSPAFTEITRYSRDEIIGRNPRILNSGKNSKEVYIEMWTKIKSGAIFEGELINKKKDGTYYWEQLSITPLYENNVTISGYLAVKQDVTEKKKNEQQILELNTNLERKVEERTLELKRINEELIKTKEAAEEANKAKSLFLANMSHEIRTPLNSIIGFSELLYNSSIDEKKRSQVESIRNSGRSLLNIINDILDLSKVEAGKIIIEREPQNVFKIVSDVGSMFEYRAFEKKLDLTIEMETDLTSPLLLDETRLRQILFNIIGNAIKFTPRGGVSVLIHHEEMEDDLIDLKITVKDSGIGIPEDQIKVIFEPFVQQQGQLQRIFGGTGLGLAISRRMAEAMGGEILVNSKINEGSEFIIYLKNVSKADAQPLLEDGSRMGHSNICLQGNTILIVDDVTDNRKLLWDALEPTGARLLEAENGAQAVQIATKEKPTIILMDIRMPVMDGMQACNVLKQSPLTADIPCIAVTASIKLGISGIEIPENFEDCLMKPVDFDQLFELLQKYIKYSTGTGPFSLLGSDPTHQEEKKWSKELKQYVANELAPLYNHVMKTQLVDEMEDFGKQLILIGNKFNDDLLISLGKKLGEYADRFDVDKLTQTMHHFQFILNRKLNT